MDIMKEYTCYDNALVLSVCYLFDRINPLTHLSETWHFGHL
jgi:hypothetical protein